MFKKVLSGILIGMASVIPGVSGGTMAVSMGIYDRILHAINGLLTDTKKSVRFLFPIAVGVGLSMLCSVFGIDYLFDKFPLETNFLFIGLILGGLPAIYKKARQEDKGKMPVLTGILFGTLITIFALWGEGTQNSVVLELDFKNWMLLFFVGILGAATLIIPGVSGSMLLLVIGYYHPVLDGIKNCITGMLEMDWNEVLMNGMLLLPFGIGIAVGVFTLAKLITVLFEKHAVYAYWCIIGLIVSSPVAMLAMVDFIGINWANVVVAAILMGYGFVLGKKWG